MESTENTEGVNASRRLRLGCLWSVLIIAALVFCARLVWSYRLRSIPEVDRKVAALVGEVRNSERREKMSRHFSWLNSWPSPFDSVWEFLFEGHYSKYDVESRLSALGTNAIPALVTALKTNPSEGVRGLMIEVLGSYTNPPAVKALKIALKSDVSPDVRSTAAEALGGYDRPDTLRALIVSLQKDGGPGVRAAAAGALGYTENTNALPALVRALRGDGDSSVRSRAATALQEIEDPARVPALIQALQLDASSGVRAAAAEGLGCIRDRKAMTPLLSTLKTDSDYSVRQATARALGRIGDPRAMPLLLEVLKKDPIPSVREAVGEGLDGRMPLDMHTVTVLMEVIEKDTDDNVRYEVADALKYVKIQEALPVLLEALAKHKYKRLRAAAAHALRMMSDPSAQTALLTALKEDKEVDVRVAAAGSLGCRGNPSAGPALLAALSDSHSSVQTSAIRALGLIDYPEAVPRLATILRGGLNEHARGTAAKSLGFLCATNAIPELLVALTDAKSDVREEAAWALGHIGHSRATNALIGLLKDKDTSVVFGAIFGLALVGDSSASHALVAKLGTHEYTDRGPRWIIAASCAVSFLGREEGLSRLRMAIKSDSVWERLVAIIGLIKIGTQESRTILAENKNDRDKDLKLIIARALEEKGPLGLAEVVADRGSEHREYCVRCLLFFNDPRTCPILKDVLEDNDPDIQGYVRLAISRIENGMTVPNAGRQE